MLNVIGHRPLVRPRIMSRALLTVLSLHKAFRPVNCLHVDRLHSDRLHSDRLHSDRLHANHLHAR